MKRTIIILLALMLISCGALGPSMYPHTAQDLCEFRFPRDMPRQERCLDEQMHYVKKLYQKLVYYNVVDSEGNIIPKSKSKVEYKIFRQCRIRRSPNYAAMNYCFDYWLDEYERTGRWGVNAPAWQW
jgi:hypothetical protein